jgi:hypothetical protein
MRCVLLSSHTCSSARRSLTHQMQQQCSSTAAHSLGCPDRNALPT